MTNKSPYHKFEYKGYSVLYRTHIKIGGEEKYMCSARVFDEDNLFFSLATKDDYSKEDFISMIKKEIDLYDKQESVSATVV